MLSILIADDDESLRQMLRRILEKDGLRVVEAEDGPAALRAFFSNAPDMAILDIDMGEGMTGFDVCKALRQDPYGSSIPILFLTGMNTEKDLLHGFREGADDYIRKPFSISELLARVHAQIARLQRRPQLAQLGDRQFNIGSVLEGEMQEKYKITSRISSGGMGVIFRGYRVSDNLQVAIKTLNSSFIGNPKDLQRFLREANATVQIRHTNVASGIEVVRTPNFCFFVMEYIQGENLSVILDSCGYLRQDRALDIVTQIARGLVYLHQLGLIHRDVKPGNILVTPGNRAVLVDLGLAKPTTREEPALTTEGVILGTPYYLSPEQAMGENLDIRSDIYSLGATFYHAVTGTVPFQGSSTLAIINARFLSNPEAPHLRVPEIAAPFSRVIGKMMERLPAQRYQTPMELLQDLEKLKS